MPALIIFYRIHLVGLVVTKLIHISKKLRLCKQADSFIDIYKCKIRLRTLVNGE